MATKKKKRTRTVRSNEDKAAILEALDNGMPMAEVETRFDVNRATVYKWRHDIKKNGKLPGASTPAREQPPTERVVVRQIPTIITNTPSNEPVPLSMVLELLERSIRAEIRASCDDYMAERFARRSKS